MDKTDLIQLADVEYKKGNYPVVIELYEKYLKSNPNDFVKQNLTGYFYSKINPYENLDKQIYYYQKALEINPDYVQAMRNLAFAYIKINEQQKALSFFEKIINTNPCVDDYFAYSCLQLQLGDFENGWKNYETRFSKTFGPVEYPQMSKPRWDGEEIKDKILLVHYEQGFGDTIQFFRYVKYIKPLCKKIIFAVQPEMVELLKINDNDIEIISEKRSYENIEFDYHIPLLSIPLTIKAKKAEIPFAEGYIKADAEKIKKYKDEFFNTEKIKIGISWHGSIGGNVKRNIPVNVFKRLNEFKDIKLYSFQKCPSKPDYKKLDLTDLKDTFKDFSDTAAAMANLDLFITSDNSVFNLAGAMGVKTLVMLNRDSEWRWFLDEKTTPWYESVKIFKKNIETQDWSELMDKIIQELKKDYSLD